jgi:hypothetical protein
VLAGHVFVFEAMRWLVKVWWLMVLQPFHGWSGTMSEFPMAALIEGESRQDHHHDGEIRHAPAPTGSLLVKKQGRQKEVVDEKQYQIDGKSLPYEKHL